MFQQDPKVVVKVIPLDHWCIVEYGTERQMVLLGFVNGKNGIVTRLEHFDPVTHLVVTASGRTYDLIGDPVINDRARKHLLDYMKERGFEDLVDVSDGILEAMNESRQ